MVGKFEFVAHGGGKNSVSVDLEDVDLNGKANILKAVIDGLQMSMTQALLVLMAIAEHENKKENAERGEEE